jgi:hypothetical protein
VEAARDSASLCSIETFCSVELDAPILAATFEFFSREFSFLTYKKKVLFSFLAATAVSQEDGGIMELS